MSALDVTQASTQVQSRQRRSDTNDNISCKVVLVGDAGVGKSCFMKKYVEDTYVDDHIVTIGVDYKSKIIERENEIVKLNLWDTAGEERFRATSASIYKGADAALLFYDTSDRQSFKNLSRWKQELDKLCSPSLVVVLVGTKCDLHNKRTVSYDEAQKLAASWGTPFFETSSKTGEHIEDAIVALTEKLIEKNSEWLRRHEAGKMEKDKKKTITLFFRNLFSRSSS
jgi:Ras-related protein Rab-1A